MSKFLSFLLQDTHDRIYFSQLVLFYVAACLVPLVLLWNTALFGNNSMYDFDGCALLLVLVAGHFAMVFYDTYFIHLYSHIQRLFLDGGGGGRSQGTTFSFLLVVMLLYTGLVSCLLAPFMADKNTASSLFMPSAVKDESVQNEEEFSYLSDLMFLLTIVKVGLFVVIGYRAMNGTEEEKREAEKEGADAESIGMYHSPILFLCFFIAYLYTWFRGETILDNPARAATMQTAAGGYLWILQWSAIATMAYALIIRFPAWGIYLLSGKVLLQCGVLAGYVVGLVLLLQLLASYCKLEYFFQSTVSQNQDTISADSQHRFYRQFFHNETLDIDQAKMNLVVAFGALFFTHLYINYRIDRPSVIDAVLTATKAERESSVFGNKNVKAFVVLLMINIFGGLIGIFAFSTFLDNNHFLTGIIGFTAGFAVMLIAMYFGIFFSSSSEPSSSFATEIHASFAKKIDMFQASHWVLALVLPVMLVTMLFFFFLPPGTTASQVIASQFETCQLYLFIVITCFGSFFAYQFFVMMSRGIGGEMPKFDPFGHEALHYVLFFVMLVFIAFQLYLAKHLVEAIGAAARTDASKQKAYDEVVITGSDHLFKQRVANEAPIPVAAVYTGGMVGRAANRNPPADDDPTNENPSIVTAK